MILKELINCISISEAKNILDSRNIKGVNRAMYLFKAASYNKQLMVDYYKQGILILNNQTDKKVYELLLCGLAYEKLGEFEMATNCFNACLFILPESSWSYAIEAMVNRNNYKRFGEKRYLEESKKYFEKARNSANEQWIYEKWDEAVEEMRRLENA